MLVDRDRTGYERHSVVEVLPPLASRKLTKVPFVELADGRLQGVVSSGSDIARVYVSSISAGTHGLSCSTNNNRPCGGHGGSRACKHIESLVTEAMAQFGTEVVARYLGVEPDEEWTRAWELLNALNASQEPSPAAVVFSRFLRHLSYLKVPATTEAIPELHWFPSTGVR